VSTATATTPTVSARTSGPKFRASSLDRLLAVLKRELSGYFITPVAYVFIVIFLLVTGLFTFNQQMGQLFERGQADLRPFFTFHPWLYLFLIPAISMRLWAEERRQGTLELLLTLPIPLWAAVLGKFLAAWAFASIALLLTFPLWITVNYLGEPDNGVIFAGYLGSLLMAGAYLAIGSCISALTRNQVIAFVLTVVVCFIFLVPSLGDVTRFTAAWAPQSVVDAVASFGFLNRFESISKGVVDVRDIVFFGSVIALFLFGTAAAVEAKKAG
jgi:ABC-2 type transport system permease protein